MIKFKHFFNHHHLKLEQNNHSKVDAAVGVVFPFLYCLFSFSNAAHEDELG